MSNLTNNTTQLELLLETVNSLPDAGGEQETPVISVNSSTGLITATAGTKSATKQLAFQAAKTITPTTTNQIAVAAGYYTGGDITVMGDSNLIAENIKNGTTIFGVTGNYGSTPKLQNKIITVNGTYTADSGYDGFGKVTVTVDSGSALPTATRKEVNFYDYDGTILYSYTVAEAQELTELPTLPSHNGLICQGWNYDLATIKAYNRAVNVGATYITDDGKTRLYIKISTEGRMTIPLYFNQTVSNGVTIDWGDGSATQTLSKTGDVNTSHTYTNIGDYVISLDVTSGTLKLGWSSSGFCVLGSIGPTAGVYRSMLQKVEVGSNVTSINFYAFYNCSSLSSIIIPHGITSIGD